jgi:hypothetical protein
MLWVVLLGMLSMVESQVVNELHKVDIGSWFSIDTDIVLLIRDDVLGVVNHRVVPIHALVSRMDVVWNICCATK